MPLPIGRPSRTPRSIRPRALSPADKVVVRGLAADHAAQRHEAVVAARRSSAIGGRDLEGARHDDALDAGAGRARAPPRRRRAARRRSRRSSAPRRSACARPSTARRLEAARPVPAISPSPGGIGAASRPTLQAVALEADDLLPALDSRIMSLHAEVDQDLGADAVDSRSSRGRAAAWLAERSPLTRADARRERLAHQHDHAAAVLADHLASPVRSRRRARCSPCPSRSSSMLTACMRTSTGLGRGRRRP